MIAIIIENFEYLSVKNDLIEKINNMKLEEEYERLSFREKVERAFCCYRKKPLKVIPKKNEDGGDPADLEMPKIDIEDEEYLEIIKLRDHKL